MKIIIDTDLAKVPGATTVDNITSIVALSEDANFPASNLQNDFTTDLWKAAAGVLSTKITIAVSKGSAVELLNTNATSVTVISGYGESYVNQNSFVSQNGFANVDGETTTTVIDNLPGNAGRFWADYAGFETLPHVIKVLLTAASTVSAGIIRAGNVEEWNEPAYGLNEGSNDYSIKKELNNGARYLRKRNVIPKFDNLSIFETRVNCFKLKRDIYDNLGSKPLAIRMVHEKITDKEFVLFACMPDAPVIDYNYGPTNARINFNLEEVV